MNYKSLKYFFNKKKLKIRQKRWLELLKDYDYDYDIGTTPKKLMC